MNKIEKFNKYNDHLYLVSYNYYSIFFMSQVRERDKVKRIIQKSKEKGYT